MSKETNSRRRPRPNKPRGGGAPAKSTQFEPQKIAAKTTAKTANKTSIRAPNHNSSKISNKDLANISDKISAKDIELNERTPLEPQDKVQNQVKAQIEDQSRGQSQGQGQTQIQDLKVESKIIIGNTNGIEPHRHYGVFLSRDRFDAIQLLTRNTSSSTDDYGEHRIVSDFRGKRCEFRAWSPFQSKLAAGIMGGASELHLRSGSKVLYLGAGFGRSVSHISDIVGESGVVYAVEQGPWASRQLASLASRRPNIEPVIEDATMPYKYRHQVPACIDIIFSDLPQSEQVRSLMLNARHFLKPDGHFVAYFQASNLSGGVSNKEAFATECQLLKEQQLEPIEQVLLEPFKPGYALVVGVSTRKNVS